MHPATQVERTIRAHRLPGLEEHLPEGFILPHYGGYSIANLPPTVARILDVEPANGAPPLPAPMWADLATGVRRIVLVILDAVGYLHLQRTLDQEDSVLRRLAQAGQLIPLTSVFPSTTVAALTTLWTGRAPLGHGFVGTQLLLSKQGVLANMLALAPMAHRRSQELLDWGWTPEEFVTVPSLGQQLTAGGVHTVAHTYLPYIGGGLSRIFLRGMASVRGYVGLSDMWINLRRALLERPGERLFVSGYWGGTDAAAARAGRAVRRSPGAPADAAPPAGRRTAGRLPLRAPRSRGGGARLRRREPRPSVRFGRDGAGAGGRALRSG
jgi:hypothetical protein